MRTKPRDITSRDSVDHPLLIIIFFFHVFFFMSDTTVYRYAIKMDCNFKWIKYRRRQAVAGCLRTNLDIFVLNKKLKYCLRFMNFSFFLLLVDLVPGCRARSVRFISLSKYRSFRLQTVACAFT